jgi:hypothetical protein
MLRPLCLFAFGDDRVPYGIAGQFMAAAPLLPNPRLLAGVTLLRPFASFNPPRRIGSMSDLPQFPGRATIWNDDIPVPI